MKKVLKYCVIVIPFAIIIAVGIWDRVKYQYTDMSVEHFSEFDLSYLEFEMRTPFLVDSFNLDTFSYRTWCVTGSSETNASLDFDDFKIDVIDRDHTLHNGKYHTKIKLLVSDYIGFLNGKRLCESPEYIEVAIVVYGNDDQTKELILRTDLANIELL
jgi:hypothetical protein